MSLRTGFRQLAAGSSTRTTPPLPFLYQTRSIHHSNPANYTPREQPRHPHHHHHDRSPPAADNAVDDTPFEDPAVAAAESDPFAYLYTAAPKASVRQPKPFLPPATKPIKRRAQYAHDADAPPSSITLREREIFTRIFETILTKPNESTKPGLPRTSQTTGLPPPPRLTELFANTIGPQSSGGSDLSFAPQQRVKDREGAVAAMALASTIQAYPHSLRAAAARAAGIRSWVSTQKTDGNVDLEKLSTLRSELAACASDVEVLRWLETRVYVLVTDTSSPDTALYADLLGDGMDVFRDQYRDLGSVVAIFERAKALGAESYVLGCTPPVYNRAIAAVWDGFADLVRVREMVEEMRVNAVGGDERTAEVLRKVVADAQGAADGKRGELAVMMTGMPELRTIEMLTTFAKTLERYGTLDLMEVEGAEADPRGNGGAARTVKKFVKMSHPKRKDGWVDRRESGGGGVLGARRGIRPFEKSRERSG